MIGWVARDAGSDLIVMTTHGRTGARLERLGSIALQVLRGNPGLLLLVPGTTDVPATSSAGSLGGRPA